MTERRLFRTTEPVSALGRLLRALRSEGRAETLAVADENGLLIAGAGAFQRCEALAALAAANDVVPCRLDVIRRPVMSRRIEVDGTRLLVCVDGDNPEDAQVAIERCAAGTRRILGSRRHTSWLV